MTATLKVTTIVADGGTPNNITLDTAGNVTIGNGLTLAGALNAASVTATGAVNGASVTATNALTGKSLVLNGATSGTITLAAPAVAGTNTVTFPAKTGNVMIDGPAVSAYQTSATTISNLTLTKLLFQSVNFDTNSNFSASRFTPTVAGYYQISGNVTFAGAINSCYSIVYRNGSALRYGNISTNTVAWGASSVFACLVYMNGTTDYIEVYGSQTSGGSVNTVAGASYTYFDASLVRG